MISESDSSSSATSKEQNKPLVAGYTRALKKPKSSMTIDPFMPYDAPNIPTLLESKSAPRLYKDTS